MIAGALLIGLLLVAAADARGQTGGRAANTKPRVPVAAQASPVVVNAIAKAAATEAPLEIFADGFESAGSGGGTPPDPDSCADPAILPALLPVARTLSWVQAFSAPACLVNPRDPRCKTATYPRSIGNPVPLGASIGGYTVIPFVPLPNQTVTLTWDQVQANSSIGYPKPRPADMMFISISPCAGDLRAPNAASSISWLQNGCRRAGGGASLTNSTVPGVSTEYVCRLVAGRQYYYTVAPYNPPNLIVNTCSSSAVNSVAGCDVQAISGGQ